MTRISVVIPAFNEQEVLDESYRRLTEVMKKTGEPYELIFINDGSRDDTPKILDRLCREDPCVRAIHFSRNFGHQPAITAGMQYANGQAIVIIDADLQDPPEIIPQMMEKWKEGYDVVYGKRLQRKGETVFKKVTAKVFYRTLRSMTTVDMPVDAGDFRLIDRRVRDALNTLPEKNRYVRGLVSWVGFKQTYVEYVRDERFAGETKYPLKKMIKFAMDGLTAFSYKPLKLATTLGALLSGGSLIGLLWFLIKRLFISAEVTGWAVGMTVCLFFNGIILLMLGIMGEYIGRIYDESKDRPIYIVSETVGFEKKDGGEEQK